jgi:hypothetical protein
LEISAMMTNKQKRQFHEKASFIAAYTPNTLGQIPRPFSTMNILRQAKLMLLQTRYFFFHR